MAACQHQCQQLRFRWNDHVSHLSKFLAAQRHEEQFCDITLVSEDGYVLKGHQAILSSTSGYFKRVLDNVTSDQHPIVVLQGAKHAELSCLMEYIYQGVTQVNHQFMESVIDVADMLEIKGLSRMKSNSSIKKLFHATAVHSPTSLHSPQCFHPSPSRSPSPHYSGSQPPSSPTPYPSLSKMDSIQDADTAISNVETEDECSEAAQETSSDRVMRSRVSGIEYSDPVQSQNLPHADSYSDQTSGIDLSISRGGGTECSSKESYQESTLNDRMFKKRKLMEKVEEKVNDPMTDPDWGRIPDKQKDEHMPLKHKRFAKPSTPLIKRVAPSGESLEKTNSFSLENLAFLLAKQKSPPCCMPEQSSPQETSPQPVFPKNKILTNENETDADSQVEVSYGSGTVTISISTDSLNNDDFKERQRNNASAGSDSTHPSSAQVTFSLRKGRRKIRTRREIEEKRKKWLAKEKALLFADLKRRPSANKSMKKLNWISRQNSDASEGAGNSKGSYGTANFSTEETFHSHSSPFEKEGTSHSHYNEKSCTPVTEKDQGGEFSKKDMKKLKFPAISPLALFTLPPMKERGKQTRNSLTLEERIKVIEAFLDGKSQRQIAHLYGIGKTQVNGIIKKREEILSIYRSNLMRGEKLTMKRQRKSEYASLNEHLIQWYRHMTLVAGMKITTGMLRAKALQIAPQLGYQDFKASNGWLATFKANNNLKFSKAKKHSQSYSNENYQEEDAHQDEDDFYEEGEAEESVDLGSSVQNNSNPEVGHDGSTTHLVPGRGDPHTDTSLGGQNPNSNMPTVGNPSALIATAGSLGKVSQVSNMSIGTNLAAAAYNLTRDHTRTEISSARGGDISHLSDLHSSSAVNPGTSLPHPPLSKTDAPLSYKSEDAISYGYDPQSRMNEGAARGSEYNYTHYSFPGTYYGYHFLGQY